MNRAQRRIMSKQNGVPSQIPPQGAKAEFYQGSVPPPAMLKDFSIVNDSFPERIFKMAEDAGVRQMKQLENQELQIKLDAENRRLKIEASERLKAMEIRGRNTDSILKGLVMLLGSLAATGTVVALLYMSYVLLMADKTGYALCTASPIIGAALIAAIRFFRR